jgi:GGDEF domain-containing protein
MDKPSSSIFDAIVAGDLADETFAVDAEAMFFIFEQIERLGLLIEGEGRVLAGLQRLSSFGERSEFYGALAASGKTVVIAAYPDNDAEEQPGVSFREITRNSPLASERFLILQAAGLSSVLVAREQNPTPLDEPAPPPRERRFEALWSFDPAAVDQACDALGEHFGDLPPLPEACRDTRAFGWRVDLLTGLMARVIRRMEEQKEEIQAMLNAFDDAATGAEIEAWRDSSSRLPARDYFMERLEEQAKRVSSGRGRCCLLVIGVEGVNPEERPEAMREFADLMDGLVRSSDFFGHLGGGLAGIGAPGVELAGAEAAARRFANALRPFADEQPSGAAGLAIGVMELGPDTEGSAAKAMEMVLELRRQALEKKVAVQVSAPANQTA